MIETAWQSEEYAELAQEVIEEHEDLHWILKLGPFLRGLFSVFS